MDLVALQEALKTPKKLRCLGSLDSWHLHKGCLWKVQFGRQKAKHLAKSQKQRMYSCKYCGKFHLTSKRARN